MFGEDALQFPCRARGRDVLAVRNGDGTLQSGLVEPYVAQSRAFRNHVRNDGQPETGANETQDGVHFAALNGESRFETGYSARRGREFTQVVALSEHDQRLVTQIFDANAVTSHRRPLIRARYDDKLFTEKFGGVQRGNDTTLRRDDESNVELATGEGANQILGAAFGDVQFHVRVGVVEPAQDVGDEGRAQAGSGSQADTAAMETYGVGDLASGGIDVGEYAASKRQKSLTGVGEGDVAAGAVQQRGPQIGLQASDLLGQRRLCDVKNFCRPSEVPCITDGDERAQLV